MDSEAAAIWSSPLVMVLVAIAAGAAIFGMISMARAWAASAQHAPFRALGWKRFAMGYAAVPYMPEAAMVHVRRHFLSVMVMAACLLAILATIWINTPRAV
jgi:hypothetical protein